MFEIQYSLNTQFHSGIKMTPYEAVYGQKANNGILVGANAVSEFIDDQIEQLYENDSQTDIVAETDSQTHSQSNSQTD